MGLLRKPKVEKAPAATVVRWADGEVAVEWYGDLELLVRAPHIYLDLAVNKDKESDARAFLAEVRARLEEREGPDWTVDADWARVESVTEPDVEATITYSGDMRCKFTFRPRLAIASHLYTTFWALWNELALRVQADEPEAMAALTDDLMTQLDYYDEHKIGMRGGTAPIYAGQVGAGRRLEKEIADEEGLTVEEFRALSEPERDKIFDRRARASVERTFGVTVDEDF